MKVLLIGDSCLDEYHYGLCERISPEAPVPVFRFLSLETKNGMAHNVYKNLLSFNLDIDFVSNDPSLLIKRRFIDDKSKQMLLREDIESHIEPVKIKDCIDKDAKYDAYVVSDYCKGSIDYLELKELIQDFDGPVFIDTKNPDLQFFEKCIIKINNYEADRIFNIPKDCEIITTLGKDGASWRKKIFPAPLVDVFDVTGAGDIFLASLCFFYLYFNDLAKAIQMAIFLASKSVQHCGIYVLTLDDIIDCIEKIG